MAVRNVTEIPAGAYGTPKVRFLELGHALGSSCSRGSGLPRRKPSTVTGSGASASVGVAVARAVSANMTRKAAVETVAAIAALGAARDQCTGHSNGTPAWGIDGPLVSSLIATVGTCCQLDKVVPGLVVGVQITLGVQVQEHRSMNS
jgi:hypothetical protein